MADKQRFRAVLDENLVLAPHTFVLRLSGCEALAGCKPGQFVMLAAEDWGTDPLLPRAFSVLAVRPGGIADILVKTSGKASARDLYQHGKLRVDGDVSVAHRLGFLKGLA